MSESVASSALPNKPPQVNISCFSDKSAQNISCFSDKSAKNILCFRDKSLSLQLKINRLRNGPVTMNILDGTRSTSSLAARTRSVPLRSSHQAISPISPLTSFSKNTPPGSSNAIFCTPRTSERSRTSSASRSIWQVYCDG